MVQLIMITGSWRDMAIYFHLCMVPGIQISYWGMVIVVKVDIMSDFHIESQSLKIITSKRKLMHPQTARVLCSNVSTIFWTSINPHLYRNMNPQRSYSTWWPPFSQRKYSLSMRAWSQFIAIQIYLIKMQDCVNSFTSKLKTHIFKLAFG